MHFILSLPEKGIHFFIVFTEFVDTSRKFLLKEYTVSFFIYLKGVHSVVSFFRPRQGKFFHTWSFTYSDGFRHVILFFIFFFF